ncbi:uncharacterized protein LOC123970171 isoform X3 [Micropterus dolomieu]|uniref:uncharacterized protein LOC123970171 isoform X3 n=1 Tax=Micropterus dolomieu TaxID=147949 RepID=UPI001E8E1B8A|nr:uncharacterized protein LOC123970171 isoform X3 [Micropterus dolomieu]
MKYFYLSIKNVSTADSGTYWCGSDRTWQQDKYIKVLLSVGRFTHTAEGHFISGKSGFPDPEAEPESAPGSKSSTTEERYESPNPPNIGMIAGVVVFSVSFLILVIVLILYRHKLPRTKEYSAARGSSEDRTNTGHSNETSSTMPASVSRRTQQMGIHFLSPQFATPPLSVGLRVPPILQQKSRLSILHLHILRNHETVFHLLMFAVQFEGKML